MREELEKWDSESSIGGSGRGPSHNATGVRTGSRASSSMGGPVSFIKERTM